MRKFLPAAPLLLVLPFAATAQQAAPKPAIAPSVASFLEQFDAAGTGSVNWEQFVAFRK